MALGASRGAVLRQVMAKGMGPTAIGIGIGLLGAAAISSWLKSVLVGSHAIDPLAFLGAALLLGAVAAVACFIPAVNAIRIDPAIALRAE
jgi:ABC-type antimicrobial peptide transport system permease subunit